MELQTDTLINTVNGALGTRVLSYDDLAAQVMALASVVAPDLSEEQISWVVDEIARSRVIRIDGSDPEIVSSEHVSWLPQIKNQIDWKRWRAYSQLLHNKGISVLVRDAIGERAEHLLDLAGDPRVEGSWDRRGLVIGDVQSGKTANYLALFNKAADAGYKVFILLAGGTNKLRQQTQERVDEGFVGIDTRTSAMGRGGNGFQKQQKVGIGLISPDIRTDSQTNFFQDFSAAVAGAVVHLNNRETPLVFVIKKNVTVLRNLTHWLETSAGTYGKVNAPMLLLDDEADYASINTHPTPGESNAINKGIRKLLSKFERSSYVGFTATPFANVLIDDEPEDDLFPKDFIVSLESPSNYFGPRNMARDDDKPNLFLKPILDAESEFPIKHKSNHRVTRLPQSLQDAIRSFLLTNAIRDLRPNQLGKPRSMMVNVSRFMKVQEQTFDLVSEFVSTVRDRVTFSRPGSDGEWKDLQRVFDQVFEGCNQDWKSVEAALPAAIENVKVLLVNSRNGGNDWDGIFKTHNPRIIAVGGDVLSRGLTLEGLSTSYFYRKSLAYDTLMQMGRWFGYRDGYEDICRLWIEDEVANWYGDIADALDELRSDLQVMAKRGLEPRNFGLAVRCHPGAMLTVTARNKYRSARLQTKDVHVSDLDQETAKLPNDRKILDANWEAFTKFIHDLESNHAAAQRPNKEESRAIWTNVDQNLVGDFLSNFAADESELLFTGNDRGALSPIAAFVRANTTSTLAKWDVVVVSGDGHGFEGLLSGLKRVQRQVKINPNTGALTVGGRKQRLGARQDLALALDDKARQEIAARVKEEGKHPPAFAYRQKMSRPLLLCYPIEVRNSGEPESGERAWVDYVQGECEKPLVGIHISFPKRSQVGEPGPVIKYLVNRVWQRIEAISIAPVDDADNDEVDEE